MDKLRAMQMAVQIADDGSLTAAAASLRTSLAAVVRALAALEAEVGQRLFHRTTRRVVPTPEGTRYLARCRDILAAVAEADADLAEDAGPPRGPLVVTAPVLFGERHVAPILVRFAQAHPGVRCRLVLLDRFVNLVEEGVDVGVRIGELDDSSIVAQTVGHVRTRVVASAACLRRHGTPREPAALRERPCLVVDGERERSWGFQHEGRRLRVAVEPALSFNHAGAALQACEAGAGFAQLLSYQVDEAVAAKRLRALLAEFDAPPQPVRLVHPPGRRLPARTRAFLDEAAAALRQALGRPARG
jgi:DNA-binding transcriptional LysR family regulator